MFNLVDEKDKYLIACKSLKGLSDLTLKAYKIDLKQFCDFMNQCDCFDKNELNSYINMLHNRYRPKSAKRKIACVQTNKSAISNIRLATGHNMSADYNRPCF